MCPLELCGSDADCLSYYLCPLRITLFMNNMPLLYLPAYLSALCPDPEFKRSAGNVTIRLELPIRVHAFTVDPRFFTSANPTIIFLNQNLTSYYWTMTTIS